MPPVRVLTSLTLLGSVNFGNDLSDFPTSPGAGQLELINGILWAYTTIQGVTTWYPLTNLKNSAVVTQGVAATTWTVAHGLGTSDVVFMAYGADGGLMLANREVIDINTIQLTFTEAVTGRVVLFADAEQIVPALQTELVNATAATIAGGVVVANASGLTVNGLSVSSRSTPSDRTTPACWGG